jgi:hypothetical protein
MRQFESGFSGFGCGYPILFARGCENFQRCSDLYQMKKVGIINSVKSHLSEFHFYDKKQNII